MSDWHWSNEATATTEVRREDGTLVVRKDHERPRVSLTEDGDLAAVFVASSAHQTATSDDAQLLVYETVQRPTHGDRGDRSGNGTGPDTGDKLKMDKPLPPVPPHWRPSFDHLGVYAYHRNGSGENTPFRFKGRQYMCASESVSQHLCLHLHLRPSLTHRLC